MTDVKKIRLHKKIWTNQYEEEPNSCKYLELDSGLCILPSPLFFVFFLGGGYFSRGLLPTLPKGEKNVIILFSFPLIFGWFLALG